MNKIILVLSVTLPVLASASQLYNCRGNGRIGKYAAQLLVGTPSGMWVYRNGRVLVAVKGANACAVSRDRNGNFVYDTNGYRNYQAAISLTNKLYDNGSIPAHLSVLGGDDNEEADEVALLCNLQ
jgi:hypothetical protein